MSVQAISWVLDHSPAEGTERLVLLSLANHAGASPVDGAWESYPGIETIRKEANLRRERTVQEVLARLAADGHIERIVNGAPDKRIRANRRPNLYRIVVARGIGFSPDKPPAGKGPDKDPDTRGAAPRHPNRDDASQHPNELGVPPHAVRGAASRHLGVPPDGTQTVIEPSMEPSVKTKTGIAVPATTLALVPMPENFPAEPGAAAPQTPVDLFWERYPRKTHKTEALKTWRSLIGAGARDVEIIEGLDRWNGYWQLAATPEQFIPHPANWLRRRSWEEPTPATQGTAAPNGGGRKDQQLKSVLSNFVAGEPA